MPEISEQSAKVLIELCQRAGGLLPEAHQKLLVGRAQAELEGLLAQPEPPVAEPPVNAEVSDG